MLCTHHNLTNLFDRREANVYIMEQSKSFVCFSWAIITSCNRIIYFVHQTSFHQNFSIIELINSITCDQTNDEQDSAPKEVETIEGDLLIDHKPDDSNSEQKSNEGPKSESEAAATSHVVDLLVW